MSTADPAATILLVEDDAPTRTFLADNLTADGYELLVADCARDGLRLLETKFPDVALVDLGLPDGSGLDIVRRVRASDGVASRIDPAVPLVVLSGRAGELDRLRGFDARLRRLRLQAVQLSGAARAGARRCCAAPTCAGVPGRLRVGELEVDAAARVVRLRGAPVELSQKEFALVRTLAPIRRASSPRTSCCARSGAFGRMGSTRTLDSHACRLRHKLGRAGDRFVVNVWGVGYRLVDGPPAELADARAGAPPLAPAAAVAALPLMAVGRPLDAALLAPWLLAAVALGARGLLAPAAAPRGASWWRGPATSCAARSPRRTSRCTAARATASRRPRGWPRSSASSTGPRSRSRTSPPRATGAARPTATSPSTSATCSPTRRCTWRMVAGVFGCRVELVEPRSGAMVRGDRVRLAQAVGNLVANALEHGDGRVRLRARAQGDRVRIEVDRRGSRAAGAGGRPDAPPARRARAPRARPGHRGRHRRSPRRPPGGGADGARRARRPRAAGVARPGLGR